MITDLSIAATSSGLLGSLSLRQKKALVWGCTLLGAKLGLGAVLLHVWPLAMLSLACDVLDGLLARKWGVESEGGGVSIGASMSAWQAACSRNSHFSPPRWLSTCSDALGRIHASWTSAFQAELSSPQFGCAR